MSADGSQNEHVVAVFAVVAQIPVPPVAQRLQPGVTLQLAAHDQHCLHNMARRIGKKPVQRPVMATMRVRARERPGEPLVPGEAGGEVVVGRPVEKAPIVGVAVVELQLHA